MKNSISFDRAAGFYDSTRDLPEAVATQGIQAILETAVPGARFLEVGAGTGRISVPLLKLGADLVGCDLSTKMMALLRSKAPAARLAQADASQLPYPQAHFDALLTCHVMHLVGPWRQALSEYRRVLKPGGLYLNARTERDPGSASAALRDHWRTRVNAAGASTSRPGVRDEKELHAELRRMGARVQVVEVVRFSRSYTLNEVIERTAQRAYSHAWDIPDEIFTASLEELRRWAVETYGDLEMVREEGAVFYLDVTRF